MNAPQYETSRCRSCQRAIIWTTSPSGAQLPLDARPAVAYFIQPEGERLRAVPSLDVSQAKAYVSHFLTCPFAAQHSKGSRP